MDGDWGRLAAAVTQRRAELGLSQVDVHIAGGPSTSTQKSLERADATSYRAHTLLALERVLRWQPGSIVTVLAGGHPAPISGDQVEPLTVIEHLLQLRAELAELRQAVAQLDRKVDRGRPRARRGRLRDL